MFIVGHCIYLDLKSALYFGRIGKIEVLSHILLLVLKHTCKYKRVGSRMLIDWP